MSDLPQTTVFNTTGSKQFTEVCDLASYDHAAVYCSQIHCSNAIGESYILNSSVNF